MFSLPHGGGIPIIGRNHSQIRALRGRNISRASSRLPHANSHRQVMPKLVEFLNGLQGPDASICVART